jgi:hypothetical protein
MKANEGSFPDNNLAESQHRATTKQSKTAAAGQFLVAAS